MAKDNDQEIGVNTHVGEYQCKEPAQKLKKKVTAEVNLRNVQTKMDAIIFYWGKLVKLKQAKETVTTHRVLKTIDKEIGNVERDIQEVLIAYSAWFKI